MPALQLVNGQGEVVAQASFTAMVQIPASAEPLTACMFLADELLLLKVPPGSERWQSFSPDLL